MSICWIPASTVLGVLLSFVAMTSQARTETAPYEVLHQDGQYEVRQYGQLVLAKTHFAEEANRNSGFRNLFGYISGNNEKTLKIAMTTPVFMEYSEERMQSMAFVLPNHIAFEEAPRPNNRNVEVERTHVVTFATLRFSGRLTQERIAEHTVKLRQWMERNDLLPTGVVQVAGYNSPWTPPFMRRNEVLIPIHLDN